MDIPGCQPQANRFQTNRKASNPLNPVYNLATVEYKPATPVKFKRDGLKTDDIEGCKSKIHCDPHQRVKETMSVADIMGAKPSPTTRTRRCSTKFDSFNYSDVTKPDWKTSRRGDPQQPSYLVFDDNGKTY